MKKLLLPAIALFGLTTANAEYLDFFQVQIGEEVVEPGAVIVCNNFIEEPMSDDVTFDAETVFTNVEGGEMVLVITAEQDTEDANYDAATWGDLQVCNAAGNCYANQPAYVATIPEGVGNFVEWMIEAVAVAPGAEPVFNISACIAYGDESDYEIEEDSYIYFQIKYSRDDAAVEMIGSDLYEAPVYYNLLGKKVTNPSNGIYIVKQGKKVTKQIFR